MRELSERIPVDAEGLGFMAWAITALLVLVEVPILTALGVWWLSPVAMFATWGLAALSLRIWFVPTTEDEP